MPVYRHSSGQVRRLSAAGAKLCAMNQPDPKADLVRYLQVARDAVLWKLEGLSEYDVRRPMTPTGTNLLGLVKHLANVEVGYFGDTFNTLDLDAVGRVPWWPVERAEVTLHKVMVHVIAETDRHAGHADIVRELIDGTAGLREGNDNMAPGDGDWWANYRQRLEQVAREAAQT